MKEGVGEAFTINMIIIFIVITFAFVAGALNYYKAFKVNSMILLTIDKYEGFNSKAIEEIDTKLDKFGYYRLDNENQGGCSDRGGLEPLGGENQFYYCVYEYSNDTADASERTLTGTETKYYNYSVVSFISLDLPIVGNINIPVHTKGERIYRFSKERIK